MFLMCPRPPSEYNVGSVLFVKINVVLSALQDHDTVISVIDAVVAGSGVSAF